MNVHEEQKVAEGARYSPSKESPADLLPSSLEKPLRRRSSSEPPKELLARERGGERERERDLDREETASRSSRHGKRSHRSRHRDDSRDRRHRHRDEGSPRARRDWDSRHRGDDDDNSQPGTHGHRSRRHEGGRRRAHGSQELRDEARRARHAMAMEYEFSHGRGSHRSGGSRYHPQSHYYASPRSMPYAPHPGQAYYPPPARHTPHRVRYGGYSGGSASSFIDPSRPQFNRHASAQSVASRASALELKMDRNGYAVEASPSLRRIVHLPPQLSGAPGARNISSSTYSESPAGHGREHDPSPIQDFGEESVFHDGETVVPHTEYYLDPLDDDHVPISDRKASDFRMVIRKGKKDVLEKKIVDLEYELAATKSQLGAESLEAANVLHNIAVLLKAKKDTVGAQSRFEEALHIRRTILGQKHPRVGDTLYNLGVLHKGIKEWNAAYAFYCSAYEVYRDSYGGAHDETIEALHQMEKMRAKANTKTSRCVIV